MFDNTQPRPICGTDGYNVHLTIDSRGRVGCILNGKLKWADKPIWDPRKPVHGKLETKDEHGNVCHDPRLFTEPAWVHLAVVAIGASQEYYMNGHHLGHTTGVVRTDVTSIGNMKDAQSSKPCGPIYDLTFWDCALTDSELNVLSSNYLKSLQQVAKEC